MIENNMTLSDAMVQVVDAIVNSKWYPYERFESLVLKVPEDYQEKYFDDGDKIVEIEYTDYKFSFGWSNKDNQLRFMSGCGR